MNDCGRVLKLAADAFGMGENKQEFGIGGNRGSKASMLVSGLLKSIIEIDSSVEEEGRRGRWK